MNGMQATEWDVCTAGSSDEVQLPTRNTRY